MKHFLIPGGIGYIGSHVLIEILQNTKHLITIVDNLYNSDASVLERIFQTLALDHQSSAVQIFRSRVQFYKGNILDFPLLESIFKQQIAKAIPITSIMHFAAKKSTNQSVTIPLDYYENNFAGSLNLLKLMQIYTDCKEFIFSSTAAVYGEQDNCTQEFDCLPITPYGESKLCVEFMLRSMAKSNKNCKVISLRYFNPAGNHPSGLIGDWPSGGFPANLFPVLQEVIIKRREFVTVFGQDYNTKDGSGVRDFIHVTDLAKGHLKAIQRMEKMTQNNNYDVFNLGTGHGYSVLEVIHQFSEILGYTLPYKIGSRREGDMERLVAVPTKANSILHWKTQRTLQDMCRSCIKFTTIVQEKLRIQMATQITEQAKETISS